jgi:hypothetical protein
MTCQDVKNEIPLYCYGEVSSEQEESIEHHLTGCADCRAELARHRAFLESLDARQEFADAALDLGLLASCRTELRANLAQKKKPLFSFWEWQIPFRIPVGAIALVALGFFGARYTPEKFGGVQAGFADPLFSSVRTVEPDARTGQVRISVDEVRRHVVSGDAEDPRIESLLLSAVREESNPGVRAQSVIVLRRNTDSEQVRAALVDRLVRDPNADVRLKALEGLKAYAGDAVVRRTLANVLLKDDNPNVRVQAIDLLTTHHDDSIVGVLQDAVRKEDNNYVRLRCGRLLEEMKASVGTY